MFDVFYTGPAPGVAPFEKPAASIYQAAEQSRTEYFWYVDGSSNYAGFDFDWRPSVGQQNFVHVFPNQWHKWGRTFFANAQHVRGLDPLVPLVDSGALNFTTAQTVTANQCTVEVYCVDHGNDAGAVAALKQRFPNLKTTRFVDNYLDTFKRIAKNADSDYFWIVSSLCDYTDFDFAWYPDPWQDTMLHCFSSGSQKKGDTFYVNRASFVAQMERLELLDWFNVVCYHESNIDRLPVPTVHYTGDNLVEAVQNHTFTAPYVAFMNRPGSIGVNPALWRQQDRTVIPVTTDHGSVLVPRDVKQYLKTQLYDYPYIDLDSVSSSALPLDVIFISNGEPMADQYWQQLQEICPRALRSDGVDGRVAAYQAAANLSRTPWFFAVFAKLEISPEFDFEWQPDMLQMPRHYIFYSKNPLNGLEYGHQGAIAYNKKLVLENNDPGLDFTLSQLHSVVPVVSGVAHFNQDPWTTWRTAFREVIKLMQYESQMSTVEGKYRLRTWLTRAQGDYAEWCLRGASDAAEYYQSVNGDHSKLMLSFEWSWLREYFNERNC